MPKVKSLSIAAVAARERRINELEIKRFNYTLKEFIEFKYNNIFEEYSVFYKALSERYPTKKNLTKTTQFKEWKKQTIEQAFEKDGVRAEVTDLIAPESDSEENTTSEPCDRESDSEENTTNEANEAANEIANEIVNEAANEASDRESDILSIAITESFSNQQNLVNINELENINNIIDGIVQDLERDAAIAEIMNENIDENDDEGIALDIQSELESIVESFDYEVEI